jgi:hypothetical protein
MAPNPLNDSTTMRTEAVKLIEVIYGYRGELRFDEQHKDSSDNRSYRMTAKDDRLASLTNATLCSSQAL